MATLRNKTTEEGIIVRWKPYPDHSRPSTYQVTSQAVSFLADLGFEVPDPGDETEVPWDICRPLRILNDLYFKSSSSVDVETDEIGNVGQNFAQGLNESQRQRLKDYIAKHNNYEKNTEALDGEISSLPSNSDSSSNNSTINKTELQEGDKFTAEVDRISSSGNGIIEANRGHINVGPLEQWTDGKEIEVEVVTESFGICVTPAARGEQYTTSFWKIHPDSFHKYGKDTIDSAMFCKDCGSVALRHTDLWTCGTCGSEFYKDSSGNYISTSRSDDTELPATGDIIKSVSLTTDTNDNICSKQDKRIKINGDVNLNETVDVEIRSRRETYVVGTVVDPSKRDGDGRQSIEELRNKAKKSARDNVSINISESTSKTASYSRSQEVKNYVKARADGTCEGCTESAPFTSKTGEPYLQVHHIHELSQGGSDAPDNVAALCPNCHYRIHHGEDGEDYNENLLTKIQRIEDAKE